MSRGGPNNGVNIKDKISLWEGKDLTHNPSNSTLLSKCGGKRADLLTKTQPATDTLNSESDGGTSNIGEENVKNSENPTPWLSFQMVNGGETMENSKGTEKRSDSSHEKENVDHLKSRGPNSPSPSEKPLAARGRKGSGRCLSETPNQKRSEVFVLFRKLEAMGANGGKMPAEPGNYFSPPDKDNKVGPKSQSSVGGESRGRRENVYTEPGAPPINPIPKPKRTFQHPPPSILMEKNQGARGHRNLPSLPSVLPKSTSKPPSGLDWRQRAGRVSNSTSRRSFELEDYLGSQGPLSCSWSLKHHYEDISDLSKENLYEDIELGSQCSQQSLPSSPGADTTKALRPGFFRQSSNRSLKLLDLRRADRRAQTRSRGGVSSPPQLSPPSTPTGTDHSLLLTGDPYTRIGHRIPTVVLRINSVFEARSCKKRLRRIYHYAETSSGRATDENSDSESEFEERTKAHRRRYVPPSITLKWARARPSGSYLRKSLLDQDLHQRKLFEYFLVVSLQKSKADAQYLPEVTQQFPPKLERSFKFMRDTDDQLKIIPQFCFPDSKDWESVKTYQSEMFSFVLTAEDGSRRFGYCRRLLPSGKGKRLPEVYCIISHLGCFNLFSKVLDEVERRRALSPALVQPFMRAIMEAQFPAPGRTISIKTFLPGSGTEVMELCRPPDSRLEHVDFECLFSCLSLRLLLRVFGSLLLEKRVIFTADKLSTLSQCCHAVVALLYPFVWQHTYVPVLPSAMLDIVCTPTPFIVGLLSRSLPRLAELPLEEVLVVDLGNNRFLRQVDDENSILPSKLQSALENVLERRRELANERGGHVASAETYSGHLSTVVSEAFVRFFVELVGHYPLFITGEREDGYSSSSSSPATISFHREGFLKAIPSKTVRRFLDAFTDTQMFAWFIQERELHQQALRGLFEVRVQEYLASINESEHRRVNRFLKGLGSRMKFLSKK